MRQGRATPAFELVRSEQTMEEQEDLELLCADRPLRSNEIFRPNAYYGHDLILKRFAQLPADRPLKIAVPHGVAGLDQIASFGPRELVPVAIWTHEERRRFEVESGVTSRLWPMAMPYLYLLELQREVPRPARRGTIFFPIHSTTGYTVLNDFAAIADRLLTFPPERQPVTVCVYWRDVQLGHHQPFLDRGLRVVSAGHSSDPLFLLRFHHLCASHTWVAGSDLGTHLFYAVASGCSFFHVDMGQPEWDLPVRALDDAVYLRVNDEMLALADAPAEAQRAWVDGYLGAQHLRSPSGLRAFLRRAEIVDKVGFDIVGSGSRRRLVAPTSWRRAARVLVGFLRRRTSD